MGTFVFSEYQQVQKQNAYDLILRKICVICHMRRTGMTRIGILHYNTLDEVDRILRAIDAA